MAERIVEAHRGARREDILRTLTEFTARSIFRAYRDFILKEHRLDRVILAGGGAKNVFLVSLLRDSFGEVPVTLLEDEGIPAQAREALCFAVLANETVAGHSGNVPRVTGAARGAVLGKISF